LKLFPSFYIALTCSIIYIDIRFLQIDQLFQKIKLLNAKLYFKILF